jgi:hypothetical protein
MNSRNVNRTLRTALVSLALAAGAVIPALMPSTGCTSSVVAPACTALNNCCMYGNVDDPSSCAETAMSGELDDAECGQRLEMYEQGGECPVDGGSADAVADAKKQ